MKMARAIFRQEAVCYQQHRVCSKKFVQQGRSYFSAQSVPSVREHRKIARMLLPAFVATTAE